jgi:O-succinylbenzoate synthase
MVAAVIPERLEVFRYQLSFKRHVRVGDYNNKSHPGFLVCVTDGKGRRGWGDVAPLMGYSRESPTEAEANIKAVWEHLRRMDLPEDASFLDAAATALVSAVASVRFGFETALSDLVADARNVPMYRLWRDADVPTIPVAALLQGPLNDVVRDAAALRAAGYVSAKLKVGGVAIGEDIERVRQVREALGPLVRLRLDANRAWSLDEALAFGEGVRGAAIDFIEEPVSRPEDVETFHARTGLPVALDETIAEKGSAAWGPGLSAVVLKPTVLGGITASLRLADAAQKRGLRTVISSTYESGVGLMALGNLAAALGTEGTAAGLGTWRWIGGDVLDPAPPLGEPEWAMARLSMRHFTVDRSRLLEI